LFIVCLFRGHFDLALIQLKAPIPSHLADRVEFACLPASNDIRLYPPTMTEWGWGMRSKSVLEPDPYPTAHLRHVDSGRPQSGWSPHLSTLNGCREVEGPTFCLFSLTNGRRTTGSGDSGAGSVARVGTNWQGKVVTVLYGVHTSSHGTSYSTRPGQKEVLTEYSINEATAHHLSGECFEMRAAILLKIHSESKVQLRYLPLHLALRSRSYVAGRWWWWETYRGQTAVLRLLPHPAESCHAHYRAVSGTHL
jgi:Trypsin